MGGGAWKYIRQVWGDQEFLDSLSVNQENVGTINLFPSVLSLDCN